MRLTATGRTGKVDPPLPMPYRALDNRGVRPRRGQMSLTVAAPGVGKSQLWQNLAHRMGVPTLYWSADTSQHDVLMRACAMWSGHTTDEVEKNWTDGAWRKHYEQLLEKSRHIDWVFDPEITDELLSKRLKAFAERHGQFPHLVVADNLSNTVRDQSSALAEQSEVMTVLQKLARQSNAHVAVLAHAKGEYESGDKPIPMGGSLNNLFKLPEMGITLHRRNGDLNCLGLNLVKVRGGRPDPGAKAATPLPVDLARATVKL